MRTHPPSTINRPTIFEYMEETFYYRESQMSKGVLVDATAVIEEYPRFIDYDSGKLVSLYLQNFRKIIAFINLLFRCLRI